MRATPCNWLVHTGAVRTRATSTADAIWDEDARRTPWTQHPDGVLVVGILRAIAINILAILRALSRIQEGLKSNKPTWKNVIEQALLVLCDPLLDMEAFNALDV